MRLPGNQNQSLHLLMKRENTIRQLTSDAIEAYKCPKTKMKNKKGNIREIDKIRIKRGQLKETRRSRERP